MYSVLKSGFFLMSLSVVLVLPASVLANISTTPWIYEIIQNGQDVEITFSVFKDSSDDRVLEDWAPHIDPESIEGIPFPDLSNAYTLERSGQNDNEVIFEDRIFFAEEADFVTEYTCQDNGTFASCGPVDEGCTDCDGDGIEECLTYCAVAYRYTFIDSCPPPGEKYYLVNTPETKEYMDDIIEDTFNSLGSASFTVHESNASCSEDSSGCSVTGIGIYWAKSSLLIFLTLFSN
jgi:hypothetical protein